ncbi:MAG: hypothetical protein JXQ26_00510 [Tissierellales bacterium]|nr:hypothetical protein [Tissierellales bacterium]MBN2826437.1 hypothetical protein [Tissierellales bacterium]
MTIKLYESDAYLKEKTCRVAKNMKEGDDIFLLLDQTIFFPEGGGQPCDLGMIGDANILHVFEKQGEIWHKVDREVKQIEVLCRLDWERRFDHMQQHCGEHILSGVFKSKYGLHNKGFHLGVDEVTIDIDSIELTSEMIEIVELFANKAIYENHHIHTITVENAEDARAYPIRKNLEVERNIRIVDIESTDCVACCGTHPRVTGEVGLVKIMKTQKYKGMTRVFFKCGLRALKDFQKEHEILLHLNRKYSSETNMLLERIENENNKFEQVKEDFRLLKAKLCGYEADELIKSESTNLIQKIYKHQTMSEMTQIKEEILKKGVYTVLLASLSDGKIILAQNSESGINCGHLFKENIRSFEGKGGGSHFQAQGSFDSTEQLEAFYHFLLDLVKSS